MVEFPLEFDLFTDFEEILVKFSMVGVRSDVFGQRKLLRLCGLSATAF